jgi:hypothetical protein
MTDSDNFLTREQIDSILDGMTARDIFAAMPEDPGSQAKGSEIAGNTFEKAAERQGHGTEALDRVRPADAVYLAGALGEVFTLAGPKADAGESSPPSAASGDSAPQT